ncbi:MAG: hypothetical protein LBV49_13615, partial [Azonexus sp.]|nr:hypothetical protein [Azonexus sp.]
DPGFDVVVNDPLDGDENFHRNLLFQITDDYPLSSQKETNAAGTDGAPWRSARLFPADRRNPLY